MKKETKVFVLDLHSLWKDTEWGESPIDIDDEEFREAIIDHGEAYTLNAFAQAFNEGEFDADVHAIRFIEVEPEKPILNDVFQDWSKIYK
jgi:hypothetical protein